MNKKYIIFPLIIAAGLSACTEGSVSRSIGLSKKSPDEFMVISRPPLSLPPDFSLRAPMEEGEITPGIEASEDAKNLLFTKGKGENIFSAKPKLGNGSAADRKFLEKIGTGDANTDIRRILSEETAEETIDIKEEEGYFGKFIPSIFEEKEPIVDAQKEKERLAKNLEEDKSPTEGETPTKKIKRGRVE